MCATGPTRRSPCPNLATAIKIAGFAAVAAFVVSICTVYPLGAHGCPTATLNLLGWGWLRNGERSLVETSRRWSYERTIASSIACILACDSAVWDLSISGALWIWLRIARPDSLSSPLVAQSILSSLPVIR